MRKEKSCGCIVINEKSEVLLVKMQKGHWSFPKGHVEENETEEETAKRETLEETNISVEIIPGFKEKTNYSPFLGVTKDVIFFIGRPLNLNIVVQEAEIQESNFYTLEVAKEKITYNSDLYILNKAEEFYKLKKAK